MIGLADLVGCAVPSAPQRRIAGVLRTGASLFLLILWPLCFCKAEDLKIGVLAPPQDPDILSLEQGARLAIEDANKVDGVKTELVVRGRPGQWGMDGDEAAVLALDESVKGIIAPPDGSASHQVMQVAGRTRIPVVTLCSDSSVTGSGIPWVLRISPRTDEQAQVIFGAAIAKSKRFAALVSDGRAGREAAKDLRTAAMKSGCSLSEPVRLPPKKEDWDSTFKKLLANNPQAVLLWLDPVAAGDVATGFRKLGYKGVLAGPSRLNSTLFLKQASAGAEGFLIPGIVQTQPSPFPVNFRKRFDRDPDFTALMAADAAGLIIQILREATNQPPYRMFPLKKTYIGASGPLLFDKDGNRHFPQQLLVCRNGEFVPQK